MDAASRALHLRDEAAIPLVFGLITITRVVDDSPPGLLFLVLACAMLGILPVINAHRESRTLTSEFHLLVVVSWIALAGGAVWTTLWVRDSGQWSTGAVGALWAVSAGAVLLAVVNGFSHLARLGDVEWEGPGDGRTSGSYH